MTEVRTEESIYRIQTKHNITCLCIILTFLPRSSVDEWTHTESSSSSMLTRLALPWLQVVHGGLWRAERRASPRLSTGITCGGKKRNTVCNSTETELTSHLCKGAEQNVVTSVSRKFSNISTRLDLGVKSTCLQSVIQNWSRSKLRWKIFSLSPDMSGPCLAWKTNIQPVQAVSYRVLMYISVCSLQERFDWRFLWVVLAYCRKLFRYVIMSYWIYSTLQHWWIYPLWTAVTAQECRGNDRYTGTAGCSPPQLHFCDEKEHSNTELSSQNNTV